jgi:hypothetical protein
MVGASQPVVVTFCRCEDDCEEDISDDELDMVEVELVRVVNAVKVVEMQIGTLVMFKPVHELIEIEVMEGKQELINVEDSMIVVWDVIRST